MQFIRTFWRTYIISSPKELLIIQIYCILDWFVFFIVRGLSVKIIEITANPLLLVLQMFIQQEVKIIHCLI